MIRHGLAAKRSANEYPDDDLRPLLHKGGKSFGQAARGLKVLGTRFKKILTSPSLRALQTAKILGAVLSVRRSAVFVTGELDEVFSPAEALKRLGKMKLPRSIALVGHEPWLGEFLSLLTTGKPGGRFRLDKGGCCLVEAASLGKAKGTLVWLLTQNHLRALGREQHADKSD